MARIITSEDDVPKGWVRIADLTDNATDAKILSDAHTNGDLDAVKLIRTTSEIRTGPVWVEAIAARALLSRCQAKRDGAAKPASAQADNVTPDYVVELLQSINDSLGRIAAAADAMAARQ